MHRESERKAVTQGPQHGAKRMPRHLPVGPDSRHDLVEPDIGDLQGPVKDVEACGAHDGLPWVRFAKKRGAQGAVPIVRQNPRGTCGRDQELCEERSVPRNSSRGRALTRKTCVAAM